MGHGRVRPGLCAGKRGKPLERAVQRGNFGAYGWGKFCLVILGGKVDALGEIKMDDRQCPGGERGCGFSEKRIRGKSIAVWLRRRGGFRCRVLGTIRCDALGEESVLGGRVECETRFSNTIVL